MRNCPPPPRLGTRTARSARRAPLWPWDLPAKWRGSGVITIGRCSPGSRCQGLHRALSRSRTRKRRRRWISGIFRRTCSLLAHYGPRWRKSPAGGRLDNPRHLQGLGDLPSLHVAALVVQPCYRYGHRPAHRRLRPRLPQSPGRRPDQTHSRASHPRAPPGSLRLRVAPPADRSAACGTWNGWTVGAKRWLHYEDGTRTC